MADLCGEVWHADCLAEANRQVEDAAWSDHLDYQRFSS